MADKYMLQLSRVDKDGNIIELYTPTLTSTVFNKDGLSLDKILSKMVVIIKVEVLPETDIKEYPFLYALQDVYDETKYTLYEYYQNKWIRYGGSEDTSSSGDLDDTSTSSDLSDYLTKSLAAKVFVRKITGMGLSSNDFNDYYREKLDGISPNANYFDESMLKNVKISTFKTDKDHLTVTSSEKENWNDKYTKNEIDKKLDCLDSEAVWLPSVANKVDLYVQYPNPKKNQRCTTDDGTTYMYDGNDWIKIASYNMPLATEEEDGKMSKSDKAKLNTIEEGANYFDSSKVNLNEVSETSSRVIMTVNEREKLENLESYLVSLLSDYRKTSIKITEEDLSNQLLELIQNNSSDSVSTEKIDEAINKSNQCISEMNDLKDQLTESERERVDAENNRVESEKDRESKTITALNDISSKILEADNTISDMDNLKDSLEKSESDREENELKRTSAEIAREEKITEALNNVNEATEKANAAAEACKGGSSSSSSIELGETADSAYYGDKGKIAYEHSQEKGNPHETTMSDLGMENVENKSSEMILDELSSDNVESALGFKPTNIQTISKAYYDELIKNDELNPDIMYFVEDDVDDSNQIILPDGFDISNDINDDDPAKVTSSKITHELNSKIEENTSNIEELSNKIKDGTGNVTADSIKEALGYVPANIVPITSDDYKELVDNKGLDPDIFYYIQDDGTDKTLLPDGFDISNDINDDDPVKVSSTKVTHELNSKIEENTSNIEELGKKVSNITLATKEHNYIYGTLKDNTTFIDEENNTVDGDLNTQYIDTTNNVVYIWSGKEYIATNSNLGLGDSENTAFPGDKGQIAYEHSQTTGNPHGTTLSDLGLENVENKSTEMILDEMTAENVTNALGYTPTEVVSISKEEYDELVKNGSIDPDAVYYVDDDPETVSISNDFSISSNIDDDDENTLPNSHVTSELNKKINAINEKLNSDYSLTPEEEQEILDFIFEEN